MKLTRLGAAVAVASLVVAACGGASGGDKVIKVGISLPLSGSSLASAGPARDGALLAIKEFSLKGYKVEPFVLDHSVNGVHDPQQGAKDMTTLVSDAAVMAVVGPFNSSVAKVQIPVSNEAGLLQCSPANTNPDLTQGEPGRQLRAKYPDRISYVRVAATDLVQGPAVAQLGVRTSASRRSRSSTTPRPTGRASRTPSRPSGRQLGGEVVGREGAPKGTTDYLPILTKFKEGNPDAVFYGGVTATGGGLVRKQMPQAGLGDLVYLGGDGIQDGRGDTAGSFINIAGDAAPNSYSSVAAIAEYPGQADFAKKYEAEYKVAPGAYSASGLCLCPGHPPGHRDGGGQGRCHPRDRPRRRHGLRDHVRDRPRPDHVRCRRRHEPEDHLALQGRHDRRRRHGRLGLREAGRLRGVGPACPALNPKPGRPSSGCPGFPPSAPSVHREP